MADRRAARARWAALAVLGLLAAGLAGPLPGTAHAPNDPLEGAPNPAGLAAISFKGPPGTVIEDKPCPPITDPDRPLYYAGPNHIGHVNAIVDLAGTPADNFVQPGSVDFWHFEDAGYSSPSAIEGPHDPVQVGASVMMGSDGYFRGKMVRTITDAAGPEIKIVDVHDKRTYCVYGSPYHAGPYLFIHSTWGDQFPPGSTTTEVDLAGFYAPLFDAEYPGQEVNMTYFFLVASAFVDDVVGLAMSCAHLDPAGYTLAPGVQLSAVAWTMASVTPAYTWTFGDGGSAVGNPVTHAYLDDGIYDVSVTALVPGGSATASGTCTAINRPPTAAFDCPAFADAGPVILDGAASHDPDGRILRYEWSLGDSNTASGPRIRHQYGAEGNYTITLTVHDDDWNSPKATRAVTSDSMTRTCPAPRGLNRPPVLEQPPRPSIRLGESIHYTLQASDPDGDPLTYTAADLPAGSAFDAGAHTFSWTPDRLGHQGGFTFRATDPGGLYDEKPGAVFVYDDVSDGDLDGVPDVADNCPHVWNHAQADADGDGLGDGCQETQAAPATLAVGGKAAPPVPDVDEDGIEDVADNCPRVANVQQADGDMDGLGDACDLDRDGDLVPESGPPGTYLDNCPVLPNPDQRDLDGDGIGDACSGAQGAAPGPSAVRSAPAASLESRSPFGILHATGGIMAVAATLCLLFVLLWRRVRD